MCLEDVLITLRAGPCECFSTFLDYLGQDVRLYSPSPSALLASMLSGQSVDNVRLAMGARVEVQRLADALDADPGAVDIERILAVKRSIRELDALADEQRYAFGVLRGVAEQTFGSSQPLLEIAFGNAEYMARTVDRLDDRLSDLHDHRVLSLQDETNRRINVLTLISAIFLPLTLIAGIYGMNFEQMPELREPLAYPITLGLMGALAASLVLYFRHRGWFD
jgi:magnesium transporter